MLTFWLRPSFVLRVINRFQRIAGFDRSMALASGALTAVIPLAVLSGAVFGGEAADRIINRYGLTGNGAEAVRSVFSAEATSVGVDCYRVAPRGPGQGTLGLAAARLDGSADGNDDTRSHATAQQPPQRPSW
ncbi:hypothetical protein ACIP2Z_33385 [Streptomyces iakyrus]|uniref:Uncharacterized protein n=1 Tax=Streptomyces iakyrus TaxID=68219 RepID=A0ABW8FP87_9ACTN